MSPLGSTKIGNLSSKVRLASPEGREIVQIGSLARWKRLRFPAIRQEEGFVDFLSDLGWVEILRKIGLHYGFWAARVPPGASRRSEEGPGRLRNSQERYREPQEKLRNDFLICLEKVYPVAKGSNMESVGNWLGQAPAPIGSFWEFLEDISEVCR